MKWCTRPRCGFTSATLGIASLIISVLKIMQLSNCCWTIACLTTSRCFGQKDTNKSAEEWSQRNRLKDMEEGFRFSFHGRSICFLAAGCHRCCSWPASSSAASCFVSLALWVLIMHSVFWQWLEISHTLHRSSFSSSS